MSATLAAGLSVKLESATLAAGLSVKLEFATLAAGLSWNPQRYLQG